MNKLDKQYTDLLQDILDNGVKKQDRTGTGTISVFGRQIRHNMKDGFPLLTTKRMPFKTIVTELLWFLRGDTNIKYLVDNNCHIWDGDAFKNYLKNWEPQKVDVDENPMSWMDQKLTNDRALPQDMFIHMIKTDDEFAKKWGELGPIYGKQWRKWETYDNEKPPYLDVDQIQNLINDLKTNPDSRRLMVNAWNVGELDQMVLPPCHYGFQVYTRELSWEERRELVSEDIARGRVLDKNGLNQGDFGYISPFTTPVIHYWLDQHKIPRRAISLIWNQRSVDTFLGLPFNIASYGLLLEIIAKEVNMVPEELIGNLGDVHLYSNHLDAAKEQIGRELTTEERNALLYKKIGGNHKRENCFSDEEFERETLTDCNAFNIPTRTREPFPLPTLKFNPCPITGIDMEYQSIAQFEIENYQSHPAIKAPLSN